MSKIARAIEVGWLAALGALIVRPAAPQQVNKSTLTAAPVAGAAKDTDQNRTSAGSDIPRTFTVPLAEYDYLKREVMIPMRDGH